jgi:hypothetical protein
MLLVLSAILISIWIVGMYVFHNTLEGYLHLFLLLASNCALYCIAREEKRKEEPKQLDYLQE